MPTTLRLAALATILALAPAAHADERAVLGEVLDASWIVVDSPSLEPAAPAASVPEPAAIAPIAGAIIVALRRRRTAA